jgi:hypothetical protein
MKIVNESFTFKASTYDATFTFHISDKLSDIKHPLSQSQANLIAYRFGMMIKNESFPLSDYNTFKREKQCYDELICMFKHIKLP